MKTVSITLYTYSELEKEVQEKALEKYSDFNTEGCFWYECVFDDFKSICKTMGIDIPKNGISFTGFWSQGNGSTFASKINIIKFINGVRNEAWKAYAPTLELDIGPCTCYGRVLDLLANGAIEAYTVTEQPQRGYWVKLISEYHWDTKDNRDLSIIYSQLDILDDWTKDALETLNQHLYNSLEEEYEYQTSETALSETFEANNYLFTADGIMADRLLELAIDQENGQQ